MSAVLDPYAPCGPDCQMAPPTGLDDADGREHQDCPELEPTTEAVAFCRATPEDDVLEVLDFSVGFVRLCKSIVEANEEAKALELYRDCLKPAVRKMVEESGKKSMKAGGYEARLLPNTSLLCRCHSADVRMCEQMKAGVPVIVDEVECEPYLSVRAVK